MSSTKDRKSIEKKMSLLAIPAREREKTFRWIFFQSKFGLL